MPVSSASGPGTPMITQLPPQSRHLTASAMTAGWPTHSKDQSAPPPVRSRMAFTAFWSEPASTKSVAPKVRARSSFCGRVSTAMMRPALRIRAAWMTLRDGQPDLVATYDDKLYRYKGTSGVTPAVAAPVLIGTGGWGPMTLTAPGDADKDGTVDLLARDTTDGVLRHYMGQTNGTFSSWTEYGVGYTTTFRPLIAGAADANLDGVADMWATAGDGTLKFYKGGSSIHGPIDGPSVEVGSGGWHTIKAIS